MKEPYIEGLATHDDPESCVDVRKDGGEAFDRGTHRQGIEPRNQPIWDADTVINVGRQHDRGRYRKPSAVPRGRRPLACAEPFCTGAGRSRVPPPRRVGRIGKAKAGIR